MPWRILCVGCNGSEAGEGCIEEVCATGGESTVKIMYIRQVAGRGSTLDIRTKRGFLDGTLGCCGGFYYAASMNAKGGIIQ